MGLVRLEIGRKPYHRYSFAGGTDALQENVSSADNIQSVTRAGVLKDLYEMHQSMIDEAPPNDGHRKTILFPQHTHAGFGIAMQGRRVRLDELYLSRYVEMDPVPRQVKTKTTVLEMAEVEWEHERYFRSRVKGHFLGQRLPLWPQPPPKETIRLSLERRPTHSLQENSPQVRAHASTAV